MNIGVAMRDHYKGYRMPKSVIGFAVRYYHRYKLSLRDVSELLHDRGIDVTYETIRNWNKRWRPLLVLSHLLKINSKVGKVIFKTP